ncbi:hypothetical protein KEM52_003020 [Ascosphaera acerosa]|nr:hypothetical protein KEM52_003020 [Ascosphaera acerosa]
MATEALSELGGRMKRSASYSLNIRSEILEALMTDREFSNAVAKRLGKLRQRCPMRVHTLVAPVVSVTDYSLNHLTLNGAHQDLFRSVWEFLDTIKVSSTGALRNLLVEAIGSRSVYDFCLTLGVDTGSLTDVSDGVVDKRSMSWIEVDVNGQSFGTIGEMVMIDEASNAIITETYDHTNPSHILIRHGRHGG